MRWNDLKGKNPVPSWEWSEYGRRGCGGLRCSNSNCNRKHRSSATSSLGLRATEKAQTGKRTTPVRNGLIWCAISGRGLWLFCLSGAEH
jgi:hypothetical protein